MYDYLIVGAGLYGSVFAREATDRGYKCLVIDKRGHIGGMYIQRESKESMYINMAPTYSTLITRGYGNTCHGSRLLIALRILP